MPLIDKAINSVTNWAITEEPKFMVGARAVLRVNDDIVGFANSISYTIQTEWVELSGVDDEFPNELAPGMIRVSGSISIFRKPNNSVSQMFWQSDMLRMKVWPYSVIEVKDKKTDNLIIRFPRVSFTSRSESYTANQAAITQVTFISIGFRDEFDPKPPEAAAESDIIGTKAIKAGKQFINKLSNFKPPF